MKIIISILMFISLNAYPSIWTDNCSSITTNLLENIKIPNIDLRTSCLLTQNMNIPSNFQVVNITEKAITLKSEEYRKIEKIAKFNNYQIFGIPYRQNNKTIKFIIILTKNQSGLIN